MAWCFVLCQLHKNQHPQNLDQAWSIFRGAKLAQRPQTWETTKQAKWFAGVRLATKEVTNNLSMQDRGC